MISSIKQSKQCLTISTKHLEVCQKYSAARRIFNSLLGVWKCGQTRSFVFDVLLIDLEIYCYKFGSFYSGLHETAGVLRREANLPDPRPEANPLCTPPNRKVFTVISFSLCCVFVIVLFCSHV